MGEKLRGWVEYSRTINLGNYNSAKFTYGAEFYLDESTHEIELEKLKEKMKADAPGT